MRPEPEPLPDSAPDTAGEDDGPPGVQCRLCGRPLHGHDARRWGMGKGCRRKLRLRAAPRPPAFDVEQDTLPGL
ncbi:DUF6011 domain-containing protein [Streptomyces sp. 549]|uniref:DUF6011 domain-containing protein n=1 Tax=Streptomyces sp. 549 TaxID=3049076 RepID=UPI0024C2C082|nr:DUF6011 domain-containing protein [Streptomyces sp. 549]MDK1474296.1 DUF6011 domain-containing protein [Streptomyces sp. 549]